MESSAEFDVQNSSGQEIEVGGSNLTDFQQQQPCCSKTLDTDIKNSDNLQLQNFSSRRASSTLFDKDRHLAFGNLVLTLQYIVFVNKCSELSSARRK
jgi:hypothetical protein